MSNNIQVDTNTENDIEMNSEDEEVYEVESIVDKKKVRNKWLYKVKWVGYPDEQSTWEPSENLSNIKEMVQEFNDKYEKKHFKNSAPTINQSRFDDIRFDKSVIGEEENVPKSNKKIDLLGNKRQKDSDNSDKQKLQNKKKSSNEDSQIEKIDSGNSKNNIIDLSYELSSDENHKKKRKVKENKSSMQKQKQPKPLINQSKEESPDTKPESSPKLDSESEVKSFSLVSDLKSITKLKYSNLDSKSESNKVQFPDSRSDSTYSEQSSPLVKSSKEKRSTQVKSPVNIQSEIKSSLSRSKATKRTSNNHISKIDETKSNSKPSKPVADNESSGTTNDKIYKAYQNHINNTNSEPIVIGENYEPHSNAGSFENNDIPKLLTSAKQFSESNEIKMLVEWYPRKNGVKPEETLISNKILRIKCPNLLLDFYESRLRFPNAK